MRYIQYMCILETDFLFLVDFFFFLGLLTTLTSSCSSVSDDLLPAIRTDNGTCSVGYTMEVGGLNGKDCCVGGTFGANSCDVKLFGRLTPVV